MKKNIIIIISILIFCFIWINAGYSSDLPPLIIPQGCCVNIHFAGAGHQKEIKLINKAGFKFIRMDISWTSIEQKKGVYNWTQYDILTKELAKSGIRPLYILDYGNPLYTKKAWNYPPTTSKAIAAYAKWAAAAAKHFKGQHVVWEIWNEPNGGWFWKPKANVQQYIKLALATAKAIRKANPNATIIAPACSGIDWSFLKEVCKSELLKYINGVSVHPYRDEPPETVIADYIKLKKIINKYAPLNKKNKIPIICSEWGYNYGWWSKITPKIQGEYLVRIQIIDEWMRIPITTWYDFADYYVGNHVKHYWGIVTMHLKPKPDYIDEEILTHKLFGYSVIKKISTSDSHFYILLCKNKQGNYKIAAWTTGKPQLVKFSHLFKKTNRYIYLTGLPIYIKGPFSSKITDNKNPTISIISGCNTNFTF
jgi:hypothetical protein